MWIGWSVFRCSFEENSLWLEGKREADRSFGRFQAPRSKSNIQPPWSLNRFRNLLLVNNSISAETVNVRMSKNSSLVQQINYYYYFRFECDWVCRMDFFLFLILINTYYNKTYFLIFLNMAIQMNSIFFVFLFRNISIQYLFVRT